MSAFRCKADMTCCGSPLSRSQFGVKRTSLFAAQMSANDPKRTSPVDGHIPERLQELSCNAAEPSHNLVHTVGMVVDPVPYLQFGVRCWGIDWLEGDRVYLAQRVWYRVNRNVAE
jgi:hypothetical protein